MVIRLPLKLLLAVAVLVALPSSLSILAQEDPSEQNAPSPASRHAQVIAQGVMAMPDEEVGWRATTERALPAGRGAPQERFARFVLAHDGAVALADASGAIVARLAPGEAAWVDGTEPIAVVSLEKQAAEYVEIALRPAANLGEGGLSLAIGLPFAAPSGEVFDVDLLRDALARNEETTLPAGLTPSLLVVTDGVVWVTAGGGEAVQVTAGGIGQIEGDAVVAGGSRSPATFVVARVGPALPARAALKGGAPAATPVAAESPDSETEAAGDRLWPEPTSDDPARDTDGDGLTDGDEATLYGTEPGDSDTDDDGLDDAAEIVVHGTNPFLADTDGDGIADMVEVDAGTDPLDVESFPAEAPETPEPTPERDDAVASPMALGSETLATPSAAALDPDGDLDGDGLSNADETDLYGTDPTSVDTDGDGFSDGGEVAGGRDPLDPADG
jgi:hypothetical protein